MTSPAVDVPRDIPLKTEKANYMPHDDTGFPFDKDFDRNRDTSGRIRSHLDDFAKYIPPEFADHFPSFNSRAEPSFRRFAEDFPTDFEDIEFPFNQRQPRTHHYYQQQPPPEYYQHPSQKEFYQQNPQQQYYQEPAQEYYQAPSQEYYQPNAQNPEPSCSKQEASCSEHSTPAETKNNLQQSNTVDLGQQQEPVNDRSQRSMSAPPENPPRFKSSINIPMNSNTSGSDNAQQQADNQSQSQQQQSQGNKPVERVIPIHVEGRDGPYVPRNTPPNYSRSNTGFASSPEPERIFGNSDYYKKFMNQHDPRRDFFQHDMPRRENLFQQRQQQPQYAAAPPQQKSHPPQPQAAPKQQQYQAQAPPPPPQPQQQPQPQPQSQPQKQASPPPPAPPKPLSPLEQIETILKDANELKTQVEKFAGKSKDKQYLYLDEMLTRIMIKLDNIDTQGQDAIRTARKEAVRFVQQCINELESKGAANSKIEEKMDVESKPEQPETGAMETEAPGNETVNAETKEIPSEPMEVESLKTEEKTAADENRAVLVTEPPKDSGSNKEEAISETNNQIPNQNDSQDNKEESQDGGDKKENEIKSEPPADSKDDSKDEPKTENVDGEPKEEKKEKKKIKKKVEKK